MKKFATSDLHFDHKNIIKYSPDSRGHIVSVDEMNVELLLKFNSIVSPEDHTFILGDIAFSSPEKAMNYLRAMNGTKTIILGNHDRKLYRSTIFNDPKERALAGIVEVERDMVISHTVNGKNYGIHLHHHPIESWDGMHHGSIHLHGHEHGNGRIHPGRRKDVGVDTNNLFPYNLDDLVLKLAEKPFTFEGHHDGARE